MKPKQTKEQYIKGECSRIIREGDNLKELAKALIKAIDENTISQQIYLNESEEFCDIIPNQYIADELEALREAVK